MALKDPLIEPRLDRAEPIEVVGRRRRKQRCRLLDENLPWSQDPEFIAQPCLRFRARKFRGPELTRRQVHKCQPDRRFECSPRAPSRLSTRFASRHGGEKMILLGLKERSSRRGPRREHPDDLAPDKFLSWSWLFHLFADGD